MGMFPTCGADHPPEGDVLLPSASLVLPHLLHANGVDEDLTAASPRDVLDDGDGSRHVVPVSLLVTMTCRHYNVLV